MTMSKITSTLILGLLVSQWRLTKDKYKDTQLPVKELINKLTTFGIINNKLEVQLTVTYRVTTDLILV